MMTQLQSVCKDLDEQAIAQAELEQYVTQQASAVAPLRSYPTLEAATQDILHYAEFLASEKSRSKTEYKQLLNDLGWKGEEKRYLKVATAFENFSPQDLADVEPATIFRLANNPKKYQPVIDELLDLPEITQAAVRELIAAHRTIQQPSSLELSIWRRTKNGGRYCQIPPIHEQDEQTGVILQQAMDDGLLPQAVVREAMQLWLDYQQGRLEFVEAAALPKEVPTFVEPEVQHEDLLTENRDMAIAIPDLAAEQYSVEELESVEQCVGDSVDSWTFEPEPEKDDDTVELGDYAQAFSPQENVSSSLDPTELLIQTFQTAADWSEISKVLKLHGEYSRSAWDALTRFEQRRVMAITPPEIKKLNKAKKSGMIVDFKEVRPDVYQVQLQGSVFWKDVNSSRLDALLMEL